MDRPKNRPLSEEERLLKQAWQKGPASLWEKPMSFSKYEQYVRDGLIAKTATSHLYKDKSLGGRGELIVGVLSYLNVHYNHASLGKTAQYFGYSPAYMSRVIREQTGKTSTRSSLRFRWNRQRVSWTAVCTI